ncbi:MAG: flagellum-specific peptidoglycan hydrolase FlgJ [Ulvibacter sp.]|jgi:flagellum-specific peptidoglycan hydrolase FlgJ
MLFRIFSCIIVCTLVLSSCKSQKKVVANKNKTERVKTKRNKYSKRKESTTVVNSNISYAEVVTNYIEEYRDIAMQEMRQYGIPASITLAQGILESGAGRGELTKKANNHFGIKCHKGWTGKRVYHDDDRNQECFRKYKDSEISFRDHSLFLSERSRYSGLFKLRKDDYKGWAKGLRKAGYATDPKYPQKLIGIIEKYNLSKLDREALGKKSRRKRNKEKKKKTGIATYSVKKGDTLYSISIKYNIDVEKLKEYNGLRSNEISIGQELYLESINN